MTTPTPAAIRAATEALAGLEACWGERYHTAARLLLGGDWQRRGQCVLFPGGIVTMVGYAGCSCQEGRGPLVCLHKIALVILGQAEQLPAAPTPAWPAAGWTTVARTAGMTLRRCAEVAT